MRVQLTFASAAALVLATACANQTAAPAVSPMAVPAGAPGSAAGPAVAPEQTARIVNPAGASVAGTSQPTVGNQPMGAAPPLPPGAGSTLPPGHPPIDGTPAAGAAPAADPNAPAPAGMVAGGGGGGGSIKGTITLDPSRVADVKGGTTLFIIVRRDAGEGQKGMLMASKKVEISGTNQFPLPYEIGPENVMMGNTTLDGVVRVEARIDQDGDAISKQPGDVIGAHAGAVPVGTSAVDLNLADKI